MDVNTKNKSETKLLSLILFQVNDLQLALPVADVERVIQIVEILDMPKTPKYICGMINMYGEIISVLNMRTLFGLPEKETELSDKLIIVSTSNIKLALWIDEVQNLIEINATDLVKAENINYSNKHLKGLVKLETGMVLFNDVEKFLEPNELEELLEALDRINHKKASTKVSRLK